MRGDFSQIRRGQGTGYTSVLGQQGRVSLDTDANEQRFLDERRRRTEAVDVIGKFGGPAGDEGFAISVQGSEILIGAGRYYVAGLLAENSSPVPYDSQPAPLPPGADSAAALLGQLSGPSTYLPVVLQVWQRLVTALDDSCLLDPALGGADTTVRLQTRWRVLARTATVDTSTPAGPFCPALYGNQPTASTGTLNVTTGASGTACGCGPVATAGYQGVENQLYRVEIHATGGLSSAMFKWSRENGSVVSAVLSVAAGSGGSGSTAQVSSLGPDPNLGFQAGQWVELTDDTCEFADPPGTPGTLYQVQATDKDMSTMTFTGPVSVDPSRNGRVRRWDQAGPNAGSAGVPLAAGTPVPGGGMQFELENGILVTFGPGTYQAGDYWTFPARTATGTVEWPPCDSDGNAAQPPYSTEVHEAPLACVYLPSDTSPASSGTIGTIGITGTGGLGHGPVRTEVALAPSAETAARFPVNLGGLLSGPLRGIITSGQSDTAPAGQPVIEDCRRPFRPLAVAQPIHVQSVSWPNDDYLPIDVLAAQGLTVTLDQAVSGPVDSGCFLVTLETLGQDQGDQGFALRTNYTLDSVIVASGPQLVWQPPLGLLEYILEFLNLALNSGQFVRVRVRLPGQAFFAAYGTELIYLDGRAFGVPGTRTDTTQKVNLRFPSGDGSAASDFESWFYLVRALQALALTSSSGSAFTTVADDDGNFTGIVPAGSTGTTPVTEVDVTASLSYAAVLDSTLSVTVSTKPPVGDIVSAPATVAITPTQSSVTIPVTFSGNLPAGTSSTSIFISATVTTASGEFQGFPAGTALTLSRPGAKEPPSGGKEPDPGGREPEPAERSSPVGPASITPESATPAAPPSDAPAPPTVPMRVTGIPPRQPPAPSPPAPPRSPEGPESPGPPASPPES